jgi:nucleoside-diphosphate-sugar epimerase
MTRVLVTGTDRPIGKAIVPRLVKYDFTPVACVGDMAGPVMSIDHDLTADGHAGVEPDTFSSVGAMLEGVSTVIHSADVRPGGSRDIPDATRALASACADRGVHLIFLSRVGADISSLTHRKQLWKAEQIIEQTDSLGSRFFRCLRPRRFNRSRHLTSLDASSASSRLAHRNGCATMAAPSSCGSLIAPTSTSRPAKQPRAKCSCPR